MPAPQKFTLSTPFYHRSPDYVRGMVKTAGFALQTAQGTSKSEIWSKSDGNAGFWIVRMDTMGHGSGKATPTTTASTTNTSGKTDGKTKPNPFFGERPHYHKNWVADATTLARYTRQYVPDAWLYNDAGYLIGMAGSAGTLHPDQKAKQQHILR